jgi:hypothetical protein
MKDWGRGQVMKDKTGLWESETGNNGFRIVFRNDLWPH